jgi:hypothetical protein
VKPHYRVHAQCAAEQLTMDIFLKVKFLKRLEFFYQSLILVLENHNSVLQTLDILLLLPSTLFCRFPANTPFSSFIAIIRTSHLTANMYIIVLWSDQPPSFGLASLLLYYNNIMNGFVKTLHLTESKKSNQKSDNVIHTFAKAIDWCNSNGNHFFGHNLPKYLVTHDEFTLSKI